MKKILNISLLFIFAIAVSGQNIEKKYSSAVRGDEAVYFIFPMKKYKSESSSKELEYDLTYNTLEDSVTYNFTFFSKEAVSVDSVSIVSNEGRITVRANMLFVEPKKKEWKHRISLRLPFDQIKKAYNSVIPYKIELHETNNMILFEIKTKDWSKQADIVTKIIQVIELNKKKK